MLRELLEKRWTASSFFYKFYDIEILSLPKVNDKSIQKPAPIYFKDLPDKAVIREAFKIATPLMKAIILFSCSSGCARTETLSLTIGDYIDALSEYLPKRNMDIFHAIDYLNGIDDVVPTFSILKKRQTSIISPTAVQKPLMQSMHICCFEIGRLVGKARCFKSAGHIWFSHLKWSTTP